MNKKIISFILATMLIVSSVACGDSTEEIAVSNEGSESNDSLSEFAYVPEYVSLETESYLGSSRFAGNEFIYVEQVYDQETDSYSTSIVSYDLTDKSVDSILYTPILENASVGSLNKTLDGNFLVLETQYNYDAESGSDNTQWLCQMIDSSGQLVQSYDLANLKELANQQVTEMNQYLYIEGLIFADDILVVGTNVGVYGLDAEGNVVMELPITGWFESVGITSDGQVYYIASDMEKEIVFLDMETKSESNRYPLNYSISTYQGFEVDENLVALVSDGSSCMYYHIADGTQEELFHWRDSNIIGSEIQKVKEVDEDTIVIVTSNYNTNENNLVYLEKTKRSELPEQTIIEMAVLYVDPNIESKVISFNREHPDYHITIKEYMDLANINYEDYEEVEKTIEAATLAYVTDVTSDQGPDIFQLDGASLPIATMIESGAIVDLLPYMEQNGYKEEDFLTEVLDIMKQDGKLYIMPTNFYLYTNYAKADIVGEDLGWTIEQALEIATSLPEGMEFMNYATNMGIVSTFLQYGYESFVDVEQAEANFDSEEFRGILELAKEFPTEIDYSSLDYSSMGSSFQEGKVLLQTAFITDLQDLSYQNAQFGDIDVTAIGMPGLSGSGAIIQFNSGQLAVSEASSDKDIAVEFLFSTLDHSNVMYSYGIPVLQEQYDQAVTEATEIQYLRDENGEFLLDENGEKVPELNHSTMINGEEVFLVPPTEEDIAHFEEILAGASILSTDKSTVIFEIIAEEVAPYFEGNKSLDEVVNIIQNRVNLYLQENS